MYEESYEYEEESYDYRDDIEVERREGQLAELEELNQMSKEEFIEYAKKQEKYRKPENKIATHEPIDVAVGLGEWIESQSRLKRKSTEENHDKAGTTASNLEEFDEDAYEKEWLEKHVKELGDNWDQIKQDSIDCYSEIQMYDFGLGKMSNEQAMADFYGWEMVRRIRRDIEESHNLSDDVRQVGQISKKLWQELRDIRTGKKTPSKKIAGEIKPAVDSREKTTSKPRSRPKAIEVQKRDRKAGDHYFLKTTRGLVRNETYRAVFAKKGRSVVYEWLWANIARKGWVDKPGYPIKERYFDKGYLAHCSSFRHVAKQCWLDKGTVATILHEFNDLGIIKLEFLKIDGKRQRQFVAVLGQWSKDNRGQIQEILYRDQVFLSEKSGE